MHFTVKTTFTVDLLINVSLACTIAWLTTSLLVILVAHMPGEAIPQKP